MKTVISSKGRITIPASIGRLDTIKPGQQFEIQRIARGEYSIRRATVANKGFVESLLACPEKGFFVEIQRESTDIL